MKRAGLTALVMGLALAGCANVTGLSGGTEFKCAAADEGVPCESISGTYTNLQAGLLPFQRRQSQIDSPTSQVSEAAAPAARTRGDIAYGAPAAIPTAAAAAPGHARVSPADMVAVNSGTPTRTPERLLRVWFAPSEDADGTFNDQRYAYLTVQRGRWLIETTQQAIRDKYQPVRNISPSSPATTVPKASPQAQARQLSNDMVNRAAAPQE